MPLTPDQIVDRIKLKRQIISWRFLTILFGVFLLIALFTGQEVRFNRVSVIDGDFIARIYVDGFIADDPERIDNLKRLTENSYIKAVILNINSPGGTIVGGENLYNSILRLSAKKPVVVVMGDVAASAGYMAAIAGDYLIAHQGTLTASIGVIAQSFEFTEFAKKIGIKFYNFKSSPLKGGPLPTEELTPEMKASMNETIHDAYNVFFNMVLTRRKIPATQLHNIADGRVFTGNQALQNGLVDAIGDEETALEWLKTVKKINPALKVRDYGLIEEQSRLGMLLDTIHNSGDIMEKILNSKFSLFS